MCFKLYDLNMHPATCPTPRLPCASMRSLILLQLLYASHYPSSCRFLEHFPVDLFWKSWYDLSTVSYTHLRAHETRHDLVCRLLLEKKKKTTLKKKQDTQ